MCCQRMGLKWTSSMSPEDDVAVPLRLIADDLTGALDSSAPFATPERPVVVGLRLDDLPNAACLAFSTESRDLEAEEAVRSIQSAFAAMSASIDRPTLWFKKVDSVLRGQPFAETLGLAEAGGFDRILFAPAYPAMRRVTVNGRQYVVAEDGQRSQMGPRLCDGFSDVAPSVGVRSSAAAPSEDGVAGLHVQLLDAETQAELEEGVHRFRRAAGRTLFVGAGGMAIALAGQAQRIQAPPPSLIIVGTRHPATLAQLQFLDASHAAPEIFAPSLTALTPRETQRQITEMARQVTGPPDQPPVLIIGGDTLSAFLQGVKARFLECLGEAYPGVPIARLRGGSADGRLIMTKSGGFGDSALLARMVRSSFGGE